MAIKSLKTKPRTSTHVWRTPNVWAFSLASLFSDWGHEMVTALLPGFLTAIGAPVIALGLTEGVSNLAQALAALKGGQVNDRYTGRHPLLVVGYMLTGLKALIALVTWWPWVVVLRTIGWLGRGARGPIRDAYIAQEVPLQHVGKAYGLRESFDTIGAVLGPLMAAILVAFFPVRTLIALTAIPAVLTIVVIVRVRKLPRRTATHTVQSIRSGEPVTKWSRPFMQYRWGTLLFSAGYVAPTFFILRVWTSHVTLGPLHAHTLALLLYTLHNAVYAASAYPVGRLADRASSRSLLLMGYALWAAALMGFVVNFDSLGVWVALFVATGLATGVIELGQKMVTIRLAPHEARGQGLGQIAALKGAGQLAAGVVMGIVWTVNTPQLGFGIESAMAIIGLIWIAVAVRSDGLSQS